MTQYGTPRSRRRIEFEKAQAAARERAKWVTDYVRRRLNEKKGDKP